MEGIEKMEQIEILPAKAEDAEGIQKLMHASVLKTYPNETKGITAEDILERYKDELNPEGLEKLAKSLAEPEANITNFVVKDNDLVIGFCKVIEKPEENELNRIHVLPDRKGGGIGTLLWKQAQKNLSPDKDIVLEVADYNENAIEVYKRWGFVDTGERRKEAPLKSGAHRKMIKMLLKAKPE